MITVFFVIVLVFSVILHEISHGYIALRLGDTTAKDAGRLTLNPLAHIDIFGTILFPIMMSLVGGPVFGWAKPVPYDPRFLKNPKRASGLIALAGPASNLALACVFALFYHGLSFFSQSATIDSLASLIVIIVQVNVSLAVFNLLPIPPLDGSGLLFALLPQGSERVEFFLRQFGFFILIFLMYAGLSFWVPAVNAVMRLLLG